MKVRWWLLAGLMLASAANANDYILTQDGCGGCGTAPFGTVSVTQTIADQLNFSITLNAGYTFHDTNDANHHALVFNLVTNPTITISALTSPFESTGPQQSAATNASPFGSFEYVINYPQIQGSHTNPTSFSFNATAAGLTLASLEASSNGVWFATDIRNSVTGATGNVAAVPEPSEWAMLVAGLFVVGFIARRRRTA